jgi:hypothetical protein
MMRNINGIASFTHVSLPIDAVDTRAMSQYKIPEEFDADSLLSEMRPSKSELKHWVDNFTAFGYFDTADNITLVAFLYQWVLPILYAIIILIATVKALASDNTMTYFRSALVILVSSPVFAIVETILNCIGRRMASYNIARYAYRAFIVGYTDLISATRSSEYPPALEYSYHYHTCENNRRRVSRMYEYGVYLAAHFRQPPTITEIIVDCNTAKREASESVWFTDDFSKDIINEYVNFDDVVRYYHRVYGLEAYPNQETNPDKKVDLTKKRKSHHLREEV